MKRILCFLLMIILTALTTDALSNPGSRSKKAAIKKHIETHFPYQLTYPQKHNRKSLSQFGYDLYLFRAQIYAITQFIKPAKFGIHSYSKPSRKEKNGALYTCRGGFIDFAHMRCAADWTVYIAFKILDGDTVINLPDESGKLSISFSAASTLPVEDITALAQKIAYERLLWHEAASWYYHAPNHVIGEQQSAFTPEDLYSNFLGTIVGRNIALRIMKKLDDRPFETIATEEIAKMIAALEPVSSTAQSKMAYDIVDRYKQLQLPEDKRNKDVWWDRGIIFTDPRYQFKRNMHTGPELSPWTVPGQDQLGCGATTKPYIIHVPETTIAGKSLNSYYTFSIEPSAELFYAKRANKPLHPSFGSFDTKDFDNVIKVVAAEMEKKLLSGFDKRDKQDPVTKFEQVKRVFSR